MNVTQVRQMLEDLERKGFGHACVFMEQESGLADVNSCYTTRFRELIEVIFTPCHEQ